MARDRGLLRLVRRHPAETLVLAAITVSLELRLGYLARLVASPLGEFLFGDLLVYQTRALAILGGDWLGRDAPFYSSTLYPYVVAGIYRVFGTHPGAVYVFQAFLGSVTTWLVFRIGTGILGKARGAVAALLGAFYAPLAFFEGQLLMMTWTVFSVTLCLHWAVRAGGEGRRLFAFLSGLALGVAASDKPNLLVMAAALPVAWKMCAARPGEPVPGPAQDATASARPPKSRSLGLAQTVAFAAGILVVLLPLAARNLRVTGGRVLLSASSGINLAIGNGARADGTYREPWSDDDHESARLTDLAEASRVRAERALGRPVDAAEADRYWRGEALRSVRGHPAAALRLLGRKALLFLNAREIPNILDLEFYRAAFGGLRALPVGFWLVGPLGLAGAALAFRRRSPFDVALVAILVSYAASIVVLFVCDRFRMPMVPILLLFAADTLVSIPEAWRERRRSDAAVLVAAVLALGVTAALPLTHFPGWRNWWILAEASALRGDTTTALGAFRRALDEDPARGEVWNNLGRLYLRLHRTEDAHFAFSKAVRVSPRLAFPHNGLADLERARGRADLAEREYATAVALDPQLVDAWLGQARLRYERGDLAGAMEVLDRGEAANPSAARFRDIRSQLTPLGTNSRPRLEGGN